MTSQAMEAPEPFRVVADVVEVPLTNGLVSLVDAADYAWVVDAGRWRAEPTSTAGLVYAKRSFKGAGGAYRTVGLHTFLAGWPRVDHRNGDGLDNRRSNLRPATHAQNMQNRQPRLTSISGLKGVHRNHRNRWRALMRLDGRQVYLGTFATPEEAARAYDAAALERYGEFAWLNFPDANAPRRVKRPARGA